MLNASIIWFTGISGTGKTTLSKMLYDYLKSKGLKILIIDGDQYRKDKNRVGFNKQTILQNNREIINLCLLKKYEYNYIIVSVISPYNQIHVESRKHFNKNYFLIFLTSDLNTLIKRDTKGLYNKAMNGELNNLIGFSPNAPYEIPINPNLTVDTTNESVNHSLNNIIKLLKIK